MTSEYKTAEGKSSLGYAGLMSLMLVSADPAMYVCMYTMQEPVLSPAILKEEEVTSFLESCEGRGLVDVEPSKSRTIHCLKQMIGKVHT